MGLHYLLKSSYSFYLLSSSSISACFFESSYYLSSSSILAYLCFSLSIYLSSSNSALVRVFWTFGLSKNILRIISISLSDLFQIETDPSGFVVDEKDLISFGGSTTLNVSRFASSEDRLFFSCSRSRYKIFKYKSPLLFALHSRITYSIVWILTLIS